VFSLKSAQILTRAWDTPGMADDCCGIARRNPKQIRRARTRFGQSLMISD
jgi:hypothetical protein